MAILLSLCVSYGLLCLFTMPAAPITTPDSAHYLATSAIVPLGYPVFLKIFGARGAIFAQPIIFAAALAVLGRETLQATRSIWLAVAVIAGAMIVPQVRDLHASILTESLFMSALVVFLALTIKFVHQPSWHLMVWVATVVGLSATIRRTGFAFVPVLLIMVVLQRRRLTRSRTSFFLIAAAAPLMVIVAGEQFVAGVVHAGQSSSLMGRHLFAKAALIDAPPAPASTDLVHAALEEQLVADYAPIRDLLRQAPRDVRAVMTMDYETCLQGPCVDRARALMAEWQEPAQTAALGEVALARIGRAPRNFARLTALHYGSLWTANRLRHPDTAPALTRFITANRPLPFEREAFRAGPTDPIAFTGASRVRWLQWTIFALGLVTGALALVGLLAAVARPELPPAITIACLAAITAHGGLLFTALLAAGFSRFMIGLWPAITTAALFGMWSVYCAVRFGRPWRNTNF